MTKFSDWLERELADRNWSPAEFSRRMNKDQSVVSRILSGEREPRPETLETIARALSVPSEEVFRAAGLIPFKQKSDEKIERGKYLLENYKSPETKDRAIEYLEFLQAQEERAPYHTQPHPNPEPPRDRENEKSLKKALRIKNHN